eukprot:jgi/Tetstr1/440327/TSEL_028664.t1
MADGSAAIRPGASGGVGWPSLQPWAAAGEALRVRRCDCGGEDAAVQQGVLEAEEAVLAPRQHRDTDAMPLHHSMQPLHCQRVALEMAEALMQTMLEVEPLPWAHVVALLEEVLHPEAMAADLHLAGNAVAVWQAPGADVAFLSHPTGPHGERLSLAALDLGAGQGAPPQCVHLCSVDALQAPILQLAWTPSPSHQAGAAWLVMRSACQLGLFALLAEGARERQRWRLVPVAASAPATEFLAHVCWSPHCPGELAVTRQDGSLWAGDAFDVMQRARIGDSQPELAHLPLWQLAGPGALLTASGGAVLLWRLPGRLGEGAGDPHTLLAVEGGEHMTALAVPPPWVQQGQGATRLRHCVAVATSARMLLLDIRMPGAPLVSWSLSGVPEPVRLLRLHIPQPDDPAPFADTPAGGSAHQPERQPGADGEVPAVHSQASDPLATQESQAPGVAPSGGGGEAAAEGPPAFLLAATMGRGEVTAYPFDVAPASSRLTVTSPDPAPVEQPGGRGRSYGAISVSPADDRPGVEVPTEASRRHYSWSPAVGCEPRRLGLPYRVARSLRRLHTARLEAATAMPASFRQRTPRAQVPAGSGFDEAAQRLARAAEHVEALAGAPDLQGLALVLSPRCRTHAVLARLNYRGDLYLHNYALGGARSARSAGSTPAPDTAAREATDSAEGGMPALRTVAFPLHRDIVLAALRGWRPAESEDDSDDSHEDDEDGGRVPRLPAIDNVSSSCSAFLQELQVALTAREAVLELYNKEHARISTAQPSGAADPRPEFVQLQRGALGAGASGPNDNQPATDMKARGHLIPTHASASLASLRDRHGGVSWQSRELRPDPDEPRSPHAPLHWRRAWRSIQKGVSGDLAAGHRLGSHSVNIPLLGIRRPAGGGGGRGGSGSSSVAFHMPPAPLDTALVYPASTGDQLPAPAGGAAHTAAPLRKAIALSMADPTLPARTRPHHYHRDLVFAPSEEAQARFAALEQRWGETGGCSGSGTGPATERAGGSAPRKRERAAASPPRAPPPGGKSPASAARVGVKRKAKAGAVGAADVPLAGLLTRGAIAQR